MDSLTQIILGAATAEAVAGRKMGFKAAAWGAAAGTLPDLDVFLRLVSNPIDGALLHRGFSHSLVFALMAGPLLGWLMYRLYRRKYELSVWIALFFVSIVTHPMLDMFTNYGTQFLWPFPNRISFNTVFVIDPLYTIPFLVCLIIALCMKRADPRRRKWNNAGIFWSSGYLLFGVIVKLIILSQSASYFEQDGIKARKTMVTPMPLTSFYWLVEAETEDSVYVAAKSVFYEYDRTSLQAFPKNTVLLKELHWKKKNYTPELLFITDSYYTAELKGDTLHFYDLRFGTFRQLTNGIENKPLMGYGMIIDNKLVKKITVERPSEGFKSLNFGVYLRKIFKHD